MLKVIKGYSLLSIIAMIPVLLLHIGYFPLVLVYFLSPLGKGKMSRRQMLILIFELVLFSAIIVRILGFSSTKYITNSGSIQNIMDLVIGQGESRYIDADAGSAYLIGLNTETWYMMLRYSPIKLFYYLFSPLPPNWRGMTDVIAFLFDSCIHIFYFSSVIGYLLKQRKNSCRFKHHRLIISLLFVVIVSGLVFAIGTYTAGTAIRHRDCLIGVEALSIGLVFDYKRRQND